MKRTWFAVISVVGGCAVAPPVLADTLLVPSEYPTIQAGIDAAVDGDTVLVADGTYTGVGNRDIDFGGKAITLQSANGAGATTIDIQANKAQAHRAFDFRSGETEASMVKGFTVLNGLMNRGGAVLCEDGSSPQFQSCIFQNNSADQVVAEDGGGAVYALGSSPAFIECDFVQNQVEANFIYGGGGAVRSQSGSSPTFTLCTFSENSAFGTDSDGGAVAVWDGGHPEFYSCTFTANQAVWDGALTNYSGVTMHDCLFQDNVATGANALAGAYGQWGDVFGAGHSELVNCSFIGNSARGAGGAYVWGLGATASLTNCSFIGNSATTGSAGGSAVEGFAAATFTNCLFADNEAVPNGGGLWVGRDGEATVVNCTFAQNDASNLGGGLYLFENGSADVANCVFWGNVPDQIGVVDADPPLVSYSDIEGGWGGPGNVERDPLFVDPDNGDFHLSSGSSCIDAADNTALPVDITTDLDGNRRFVDDPKTKDTGNGEAPIVDMGAYEFQVVSCDWDLDGDGNVSTGDLIFLLGSWGDPYGTADLIELLGNWGPCPK